MANAKRRQAPMARKSKPATPAGYEAFIADSAAELLLQLIERDASKVTDPASQVFRDEAPYWTGVVRGYIRDGDIVSAVVNALYLGAAAERMGLQSLLRNDAARNDGKAKAVAARYARWQLAAKSILANEPELIDNRKAVAERIAKQEERLKLSDACGWRTIHDAIRPIFRK